jgi:hypothetical protein
MCTVSYHLTPSGFVITQNRDESPLRDTHELQSEGSVYYPIDPVSKGTWIAVNDKGVVCSLMNWTAHPALPPKTAIISRGTLIPHLINDASPLDSLMSMALEPYAPFKMLVAQESRLSSMIWDGVTKKVEALDPTIPHIWSSASLYPREWQDKRKEWFHNWLERMGTVNTTELLWFHNHGGVGERYYDLIMDRGEVRTTSITQVSVGESRARIRYKDLSTCLVEEHWMSLERQKSLHEA